MEKIEKIENEKRKTEGKERKRGNNERKVEIKEREEKRSVIMKDIVLNRRKTEKTMENIMKDIEAEIIKRIRKIEIEIEGKEEVLRV